MGTSSQTDFSVQSHANMLADGAAHHKAVCSLTDESPLCTQLECRLWRHMIRNDVIQQRQLLAGVGALVCATACQCSAVRS